MTLSVTLNNGVTIPAGVARLGDGRALERLGDHRRGDEPHRQRHHAHRRRGGPRHWGAPGERRDHHGDLHARQRVDRGDQPRRRDAGPAIETDAAFRLRREQSGQRAASSPLDAIVAQLLEVSGVTQVTGWENTSLLTDSLGRAGKSVDLLVLGGTDEAVGGPSSRRSRAASKPWAAPR